MATTMELSDEDVRALELGRRMRSNPMMLNWRFELPRGGSLEIKLSGRWQPRDVAYIRRLFDSTMEVVSEAADPGPEPRSEPQP